MKTLLVIGYVWPEPNSSAAGSRMMQLLNAFLKQSYRIHYASPAEYSPHAVKLDQLNIQSHQIALNCSSFDRFVADINPDVVMFDRFMLEEQFGWRVEQACPSAVKILDTEDLHSLRAARQLAVKQNREMTQSDLYSELAQREIAAIYRCDISLIISEYEMELLQTQFKVHSDIIHYSPFMLDELKTSTPDFSARQHFISIGNFRHEPNWDAVRFLKESIWPGIRQRLPDAELHIYGGYPPKKATQLHNEKQGFLIKGWAENAHDVIKNARVLLAPLRFGAGLKGKLIDAIQCGTPAVTTPIGAEGMYGDLEKPALIANSAEDFIASAIELYQSPSQWQTLHHACKGIIQKRFDRQAHECTLLEKVDHVSANLAQHRMNNFTGAMLKHHSMKSTQYMSKWIEAKNRNKLE